MVKVNIISGFLGAGKTTFIKRLISDVFKGEKIVLIENEFGEIGVDGGFLQDAGIEITEMNSGCICCSLVGDFTKALEKTVQTYNPDRIIIEPSGVGKLSDVILAVNNTDNKDIHADSCITVADCTKCKLYSKNFGEFYKDQILNSNCILLTRTDKADSQKIEQSIEIIRQINKDANIITTPLDMLDKEQILEAFKTADMQEELLEDAMEAHHHDHCDCHHHEHEHHHDHCDCHHHEHEHHHDHCNCHHEHENHSADDAFISWGFETVKKYSYEEMEKILEKLDSGEYGSVLRAKGMVACDNEWLYFDYVPKEYDLRPGKPCYTGKICVIGADLKQQNLEKLFGKTTD